MSEKHLRKAEQAVRDLAEEKGNIGAREAHDAWRWPLVSKGWRQGEPDANGRTHPLMTAFDNLQKGDRDHALQCLETEGDDDAEQDDRDRDAGELAEEVTR